jgi:ubiquinone/menaquinone biosynthesis C-methylase UbiE
VTDEVDGSDVLAGTLVCGSRSFAIRDGIPHMMSHEDETLNAEEQREYDYYQTNSQDYDAIINWMFESFYEDEDRVREGMVDLLRAQPGGRVLETGCGTCRDSTRIALRLGPTGELFLQDLSPAMVRIGRERMRSLAAREASARPEFFVGNATRLPFEDNYFDAAFHFGGLNLFADKAAAIKEMARVVKVGGRVVFGDESLAPWLRSTTYGKILMNSNSIYRSETPIELLPEVAADVGLRWIIGQAYYVIDFVVSEGPPRLDLDKPILGARGGTHRSRYYGSLEGVTPETKQLAVRAARESGISLHDWLERAVHHAATELKRS